MRGAVICLALALACPAAAAEVPDPHAGEAALRDCLARTWQAETCIGTVAAVCEAALGREATTTTGMRICQSAEAAAWQRMLDAEHAALLDRWQSQAASPDTAGAMARLAGAQRSFVAYRQDWCGYLGMTGGSIATVLAAQCWNGMTASRAIDLLWQTRGMEWQPDCGAGTCGE